jgi:hypothetical protein
MRAKIRLVAGTVLLLLLAAAAAEACPNCKETIAGDPAQQGLARGIYYSILFMMSMPFFLLGSLSTYFYYLVRRDQTEKERLAASGSLQPDAN